MRTFFDGAKTFLTSKNDSATKGNCQFWKLKISWVCKPSAVYLDQAKISRGFSFNFQVGLGRLFWRQKSSVAYPDRIRCDGSFEIWCRSETPDPAPHQSLVMSVSEHWFTNPPGLHFCASTVLVLNFNFYADPIQNPAFYSNGIRICNSAKKVFAPQKYPSNCTIIRGHMIIKGRDIFFRVLCFFDPKMALRWAPDLLRGQKSVSSNCPSCTCIYPTKNLYPAFSKLAVHCKLLHTRISLLKLHLNIFSI